MRNILNYQTQGAAPDAQEVREDVNQAITIAPVFTNPPGTDTLWRPDYDAADTFEVAVGNADTAPESGTYKLTVGVTTTGLTALPYNISAAALQTPLSAAFVAEAKPACGVTLVAAGVYRIVGTSNGAIASGFLVPDTSNLQPISAGQVIEQDLGSASKPYVLLLVLRESPLVFAEPATMLPATDVHVSTQQTGTGTRNKIQTVYFDVDPTYGGTFSVSADADGSVASCGIGKPGMTAVQFGLMLAGHPDIHYQNVSAAVPDNVSVTKTGQTFIVEFIGTLGNSNTSSLTATNIDLIAPKGVSGFVNFNTVGLYVYSLSQTGTNFTLPLSIRRTRSTGERTTIYGPVNITIYKDSFDPGALIPTPLPSYLTAAQVYALFLKNSRVFVDPTYGNNATAVRENDASGRSFSTITAASAAAASGDTVMIGPGSYSETVTLKNGVNYQALTGTATLTGFVDSAGETCIVQGLAFQSYVQTQPSSNVTFIDCDCAGIVNAGMAVTNGGTLTLTGGRIKSEWANAAGFALTMTGNLTVNGTRFEDTSGVCDAAIKLFNGSTARIYYSDIISAGTESIVTDSTVTAVCGGVIMNKTTGTGVTVQGDAVVDANFN